MPSGSSIILVLKFAVVAVTLLLIAAIIAVAKGRYRLHGRINLVFFCLTMAAVVVFEVLLRVGPHVEPGWKVTDGWSEFHLAALRVHLCFVIPLTFLLPVMLFTGLKHKARLHKVLAVLFILLWTGMFITGVFFLPHAL